MIRSMTGYGRAESTVEGRKYVVEIRSLNHRYLEISLRLPGLLAPLESELRKSIAERISRGRIEVTVRICDDECPEEGSRFKLNVPLVRNYYQLLSQMKDELRLNDEITLNTMISFKDIFIPADAVEGQADVTEGALKAVDEAVTVLLEMKRKEGGGLYADMAARIDTIKDLLLRIDARSPAVTVEYRERLGSRLKELLADSAIDEIRLEHEIAIIAEKSDITEEIVRLNSHIEQFADMLMSDDAVGRKVDFLIQEMNREVNTIGAKSNDREIARSVIEIKSELAKLREQVQNIE